jgi:hypothetical protein
MVQRYHNPFAGVDLIAPAGQRVTGLSVAGRKKLSPVDLTKHDTFKFIEGSIFDRDSWRVQAVMLVAIAHEGSVDVVAEPRRMMAIANGLAAAGIPDVVDMIGDGKQSPIWKLSESMDALLRGK